MIWADEVRDMKPDLLASPGVRDPNTSFFLVENNRDKPIIASSPAHTVDRCMPSVPTNAHTLTMVTDALLLLSAELGNEGHIRCLNVEIISSF